MANGVPVRLSDALTLRAREEAEISDRSLTEEVEHWARLGQVVERAIQAATVQHRIADHVDSHVVEDGPQHVRVDAHDGRAQLDEPPPH